MRVKWSTSRRLYKADLQYTESILSTMETLNSSIVFHTEKAILLIRRKYYIDPNFILKKAFQLIRHQLQLRFQLRYNVTYHNMFILFCTPTKPQPILSNDE